MMSTGVGTVRKRESFVLVALAVIGSACGSSTKPPSGATAGQGGGAAGAGVAGATGGGGGGGVAGGASGTTGAAGVVGGTGGAGAGGSVDGGLDAAVTDSGADVPAGPRPRSMVWTFIENSPKGDGAFGGTGPHDVWCADIGGIAWHTAGDDIWKQTTVSNARLNGVQAFAADDVYVSGYINAVYHLDATGTWDHQVTTSGVLFNGIWGSGPHDLYAVGTGVFHSTGDRTWTSEGETAFMMSVWGSGPGDVWTIDAAKYVHHRTPDGKWQPRQTPPLTASTDIMKIWGSGPTDIYVVDGANIAHSTGKGDWTIQTVDKMPHESMQCIWGSGPNDIYVGGSEGHIFRSLGDGRWFQEELPLDANKNIPSTRVVWGSSQDDVYLMTGAGTYHGHPAP
jgi:hypothetical protein